MKKLKSVLVFTMVLCICAGYLPTPTQTESKMLIASAEDEETEDECGTNLKWTLDNDGTLTISGEGAMPNWTYSNSVPWYDSRDKITRIVLKSGVTSIGNWTFNQYYALTSVIIPESVETIGEGAFADCENLKSITIENPACTIGTNAIPANATIYGYNNSTAQTYATENSVKFESIGEYGNFGDSLTWKLGNVIIWLKYRNLYQKRINL